MFTVLNLLFPIITLPYVSRIIGAEGIGKVNFSNSIVNYFLIIASLGIPLYGVREIAKVRKDRKKLSQAFSEIFIVNFLSTILCIVSYYLMVSNLVYFSKEKLLFLTVGINLFLNIFNLDWFYQGLEEYKYITIRSVIIKSISIIILFIFVRTREDYIKYALINIIAISGNNLINMVNIRRFTSFTLKGLNIKKRIRPILVLLSIQVSVNIYINLDTTMCGILADEVSVGYYSNAVKINKIIVTVVTSISTILLPRLSFYIENNEVDRFNEIVSNVFKIIIFAGIPASIGMLFVSENIVNIMFGAEFMPAIKTMQILSPLIPILAIGNLFGTQVLMPIGEEKKLLASVVAGSIVNFTLNMILIPIYRENGAALATVTAELIVMIIQVRYALKFVKVKIEKKDLSAIIFSNLVMIICLVIIKLYIKGVFLNLIVSVLSAGIIYLLINIKMKNTAFDDIVTQLKKK
ncbi:flippase [Clostridium sp. NSJ-6]|uniref:Flippase n=2 Tax=Clostridium hominis TaxID=2763036 RepID=A0ABR7D9K2_9CLOT|nr:flippase [Clostridium hominis]